MTVRNVIVIDKCDAIEYQWRQTLINARPPPEAPLPQASFTHLQPFYGGSKDQLTAEIFAPNEKKPFCTVKGAWNGVMIAKYASGVSTSASTTGSSALFDQCH